MILSFGTTAPHALSCPPPEPPNSEETADTNFPRWVLHVGEPRTDIAYKERTDKGIYAVSVRGSPSCKTHLGKLVSAVSSELGGSGGGHDKACGAVVPKDKIKKFVREMNSRLGNK